MGTKELLYIVSPIILFILVSIYTSNFLQNLATQKIGGYTFPLKSAFKVSPKVKKLVKRKHLYNEEEILASLDAIDLKISKAELQKSTSPPPKYKLTFIYIGTKGRYAIINGVIMREGGPVSSEEKVVKIEKDRVLLDGKWGKRWIYLGE